MISLHWKGIDRPEMVARSYRLSSAPDNRSSRNLRRAWVPERSAEQVFARAGPEKWKWNFASIKDSFCRTSLGLCPYWICTWYRMAMIESSTDYWLQAVPLANSRKIGTVRIEPRAAGWEARTLLLCYDSPVRHIQLLVLLLVPKQRSC